MEYQIWIAPIAVITLQFLIIHIANASKQNPNFIRTKSNYHFTRKIQHSSTGFAIYLIKRSISNDKILVMATIGLLFMIGVEILRKISPTFNNKYISQTGVIMRSHQLNRVTTATYFILSVVLCVLLFQRQVSDLAILFVTFGDPMASVIGLTFKSRKIYGNKSIAGVVGCCATCILVALIYYNSRKRMMYAILAGMIGGMAECVEIAGLDDNLTMPLISGVLLMVINKF